MYTNELFGKEVLDIDANKIGKVVDIDFDFLEGRVNHFIVKAGLMKKFVIGLDKIDKIGDRIILKVRTDELK
jgi:sporulation protein YlmC with PRC-barrel domain